MDTPPITEKEERGQSCRIETAPHTYRAIYRTLATGLCFAVFAALAGTNHATVALPFAILGYLLSRGGRNQWQA